jgi:hypothetical protein
MVEQTDYRLAFILPESRQLLGIRDSKAVELPRMSIPMWHRPAEQLTQLIEERWHIKTIVLDVLTDASMLTPCGVIEVRSPSWQFRCDGFAPIGPHKISTASLAEDERRILISILAGNDLNRGPFSRIGWIDEAQDWIRNAVCDRDISFSDDFRQLNASGRFALIRFGTNEGRGYWMKSVGPPNEREFHVTRALAERFPNHLPTIVATREDWNAWLMEDAGRPLHDSFDLPSLAQTVSCLAELQKQSIHHTNVLLAAGCIDCAIQVLHAHLGELTAYLEEAMSRQTSTKVARLDKQRLRQLECILRDTCTKMQELCIPDTLLHNDTNPNNILLDNSHCVFTDWCEAYIGNPFLTFEHLCTQVARDSKRPQIWLPQLRDIYKHCWLEWLSEAQIEHAFALMPLLAIAFSLYGQGDWLISQRRDESRFQSYRRSLARHMDRAAQAPELLEALCQ